MKNSEYEKSKAFIISETIEYVPHSIVIKTIVKKMTGTISIVSFDAGEELTGKISPYDTFIQVISGEAEVIINEKSSLLENGQCILIPAHSRSTLKATVQFKMLSTFIKSGYEEVT